MPKTAQFALEIAAATAHHHHGRLKLLVLAVFVVMLIVGALALVARARARRRAGNISDRRRQPETAPAISASAAIVAEHLAKTYRAGSVAVRALDDVSLEIEAGTIVGIMGKSGSGKSTLLHQLGLIDLPSDGRIYLSGREVTGMSERARGELRLRALGYVFQEYALLPELSAQENVYLPAMMAGRSPGQCRRRALELLELVGLDGRATHRPKQLSGGEQQRVAIARALVNEPRILYADEPTANLDSVSAKTVMETLAQLNRTLAVTVVFVSHDPDDARYANRLLTLADGRLVA